MRKKPFTLTAITGILVLLLMGLWPVEISAKPVEKEDEIILGVKVQEKIKIDGMLDEKIWQTPPIKKKFITTKPSYGYELPMETLVWVAYDTKNLYFAFRCHDPEPEKIKTSVTKRDNISTDDWVSVSVDAMGNGQSGYILFVNPSGIQGDALTTSVHVDDDFSPDYVWDSAAKLTKEGYDVEIRLPLKSIRFKSGKKVEMGILFRRRINRLSYEGAWPDIKLNSWILTNQAKAVFKDLKKQVKLEILPSLTHSSNSNRETPDQWSESETSTDFGIGLKYGLTSATTAEITINPDFSQVESDALQVEVNQRYPLFYSEKRPFFMEGMEIFNFWTYIYGYFPKAVHTRQIARPRWGAKLTGNLGKLSFGFLSAGDKAPGEPWIDGINPDEGKTALFGIARGKYGFGKDNYVGFVYTGREFGDQYNHLVGLDGSFRIARRNWFRGTYLYSASRDSQGNVYNGSTTSYGNLTYTYGSKYLILVGVLEHIGKDLRADAGYLRRNGVNVARSAIYYNIYPNQKKLPWLKTITPFVMVDITHDLHTKKDDVLIGSALTFYFTKDAYLKLQYQYVREHWQEQAFDKDAWIGSGGIRLTNWLKLRGGIGWRQSIYYFAVPAFLGNGY
ncbi:MAG: carbohydrate binding family 9 domain-containing protein, partial [Candidatus Aminicenantes bacterium]